ncbi:MAG: GTP-binding protein [Promethearchaeota archaeon]
MVNIGVIGPIDAGKTTLLKLFVEFIQDKSMPTSNPKAEDIDLITIDFSGEVGGDKEPDVEGEGINSEKATATIAPNRIVFKSKTYGKNHSIFAPGGDKTRPVIRMGIITISRISNRLIVVIPFDRSLQETIEFLDFIRYYPKKTYICFNKVDLLERNEFSAEEYSSIGGIIEEWKQKIHKYFEKRRVEISDYYIICARNFKKEGIKFNEDIMVKIEEYNLNAINMLLEIVDEANKLEKITSSK